MTLLSGLAIYFIIWWLVLFTVLPWGASSAHELSEDISPGTAPSAPVKPRLAIKFAVTTVVATLVFAFAYGIIEYKLITFDDIPFLPDMEW